MSSDQQCTHFNTMDNCYVDVSQHCFPVVAPTLDPANKGQSSNVMNCENHQSVIPANSTHLACDPRAMLKTLSFLEQKIHQIQDIVGSIMNREDNVYIQPNGLAAKQQLVTADLPSIIIQLMSTAGSLLPSINGTILSNNLSVEQLQGFRGSSSMISLNASMEQGPGFVSEGIKVEENGMQNRGTNNYNTDGLDCVEHDGNDLENGGEIENIPPGSYEVLQVEKEEILAPHTHFCSICGKGFKRDANLRMHMRGHGDEYKTPAALAKPTKYQNSEPVIIKRYSCPFAGCKRNKEHKKFQPLKSILCVKNHYKRSHCDKSYTCSRCNTKKFSVIADLKTHEKHCGRDKWICSCGTTFSRKDKLFGHVSLFQGHMPALSLEETKGLGPLDRGQNHESFTNTESLGFNFGGSGADDLDSLYVKALQNDAAFISSINTDLYNFGGLNDFPWPGFEISESSFSLPSILGNRVPKLGDTPSSS